MSPSEASSTSADPTYWAFISYRHSDNARQDREWATWLHQEIEHYDVPLDLVGSKNARGESIPRRIYPVFRDEESMQAQPELTRSIESALDRSRCLVVLCSPDAARSEYVAQEVRHFKRSGKHDRMVAVIISGEPQGGPDACFPEPLLHLRAAPDGTSATDPPLAADFRVKEAKSRSEGFTSAVAYERRLAADGSLGKRAVKEASKAYEAQLTLMKLKIIAGILGVSLDVLTKRDRVYQQQLARQRRRARTRWVVGLMTLAAVAGVATKVAADRQDQLRVEAAQQDRSTAVRLIAQDQSGRALAFLAASLRRNPHDYVSVVRAVTLLHERSFAVPVRGSEEFFPMPRDADMRGRDTDARSSDNSVTATSLQQEGSSAYRIEHASGTPAPITLAVPFALPYGTNLRSEFDDRGQWLAILAANRNATDARIWFLGGGDGVRPAIEPLHMFEYAGDRMVVHAAPENDPPHRLLLRTLRIQRGDNPSASTLWDVAEGHYVPRWVRGSVSESDPATVLSALGWKLEAAGDVRPYALVRTRGGKRTLLQHAANTNTYAISASRAGIIATGGEDQQARTWLLQGSTVRTGRTFEHPAAVGEVQLSDDGRLLLTATGSPSLTVVSEVRLWDTETGDLVAGPWPTPGYVRQCSISQDVAWIRCEAVTDSGSVVATWPSGGSALEPDVMTLADLAEAVGGWKLTGEQALVGLPVEERIARIVRCRAAARSGTRSPVKNFVLWFLADRRNRSSPP